MTCLLKQLIRLPISKNAYSLWRNCMTWIRVVLLFVLPDWKQIHWYSFYAILFILVFLDFELKIKNWVFKKMSKLNVHAQLRFNIKNRRQYTIHITTMSWIKGITCKANIEQDLVAYKVQRDTTTATGFTFGINNMQLNIVNMRIYKSLF